jgi:hypothetical protein
MRVMEEIKTEIKDTTRDGLAVDDKMLLIEVPTSRTILSQVAQGITGRSESGVSYPYAIYILCQ